MIDLTNHQVGLLRVLEVEGVYISPSGQKDLTWKCLCECGETVFVRQSKLRSKTRPTRSCGCLSRKRAKEFPGGLTHGESKTLLYFIWHGMKDRCNRSCAKNKEYNGRGIKVCPEWERSYETFRDWAIENGYKKGLTLDRIDTNGDYCPANCRFADWVTQQNNRRNCRFITAWGETKTLSMWLKDQRCNIGRESLKTRLNLGWCKETAISRPPTKEFKGN